MDFPNLLNRYDNAGEFKDDINIGARYTFETPTDISYEDPRREFSLQTKTYEWEDKTPNSRIYFSDKGMYLNPPSEDVPGLQSVPFPTEVAHVTEKLTETYGPEGKEFYVEKPISSQQYILQNGVRVKRFNDTIPINANETTFPDNYPIRPRPHVKTTWRPIKDPYHGKVKEAIPNVDEIDLEPYTIRKERFPPIPSQFHERPPMPNYITNDPIFQIVPGVPDRTEPFPMIPQDRENILHVFKLNGEEINIADDVLQQEMNVTNSFPTDNREGMWSNYAWTEQMLKESLHLPDNTLFSSRTFMILAVFLHKYARLYLPSFTKNFAKILDENKKRIETFLQKNEVEVFYKDQFYLLKPPKPPSRIFSLLTPTPYYRKQMMEQLMF